VAFRGQRRAGRDGQGRGQQCGGGDGDEVVDFHGGSRLLSLFARDAMGNAEPGAVRINRPTVKKLPAGWKKLERNCEMRDGAALRPAVF
jgi:hypothetical protein